MSSSTIDVIGSARCRHAVAEDVNLENMMYAQKANNNDDYDGLSSALHASKREQLLSDG